jgi:hypothetical protein
MLHSRSEAIGGFEKMENPATKFISWKSNEKTFSYYDKDKGENVLLKLPLKFIVLAQLNTVKGWNDALIGQIIANEVQHIGEDKLKVVCYHKDAKGEKKKSAIAEGIYKDIKETIVSAGGRYHKSVYIMLEDGTIANIQLKGAGVQAWGEFSNRNKARLLDEWVVVKSFAEGKKGAVKFTTPKFEFLQSLNETENALVNDAFDVLKSYLNAYLRAKEPIIDIEVNDSEIVSTDLDDDLAF